MQVVVRIDIDNEKAREFNREAEAKAAGNVTFLDVLEEGIKVIRAAAERIDEFSRVEIEIN